MLKNKVFIKKTRRGKILKIVREHYLRDDITCGAVICVNCTENENVLQENTELKHKTIRKQHYIIPDTNVVIHQVFQV